MFLLAVHITLKDLIPLPKYIRLNPNMSNDVPLDENDLNILKGLEQDTRNYIEKFSHKFLAAKSVLQERKSYKDKLRDELERKYLIKRYEMKGRIRNYKKDF